MNHFTRISVMVKNWKTFIYRKLLVFSYLYCTSYSFFFEIIVKLLRPGNLGLEATKGKRFSDHIKHRHSKQNSNSRKSTHVKTHNLPQTCSRLVASLDQQLVNRICSPGLFPASFNRLVATSCMVGLAML